MKTIAIFLIAFLCVTSVSMAQSSEQLVFKRKGVMQNDKYLTPDEAKTLLTKNPEGAVEYNIAESNFKTGSFLMVSGTVVALGGVVVLLTEVSKPKPSYTPVYLSCAGLGIVLLGIPSIASGSGHLKKAVNIYNSKLTGDKGQKVELNFGLTSTGIGLVCNF
ncbi:MAG: hypothetical protein WCJ03_12060 [Bacteroidales bacterium]